MRKEKLNDSSVGTTSDSQNNRDAIMLLDDRGDIRESANDYFEAMGKPLFTAESIAQGLEILKEHHDHILVVFVDERLEDEEGLDFIEQAREEFPSVSYVLLTAWSLSRSEKKRIKELRIPVRDKVNFYPEELLSGFRMSPRQAQTPTIDAEIPGHEKEMMLENRFIRETGELKYEVLKNRLDNLQCVWEEFVDGLISRIADIKADEDGSIVIHGRAYSTAELVKEVKECTPLGKRLVELHNSVIDDIMMGG